MLYHERERKIKENANSVYIVYLLTKLRIIFDEAFLLTSVYLYPAGEALRVFMDFALKLPIQKLRCI